MDMPIKPKTVSPLRDRCSPHRILLLPQDGGITTENLPIIASKKSAYGWKNVVVTLSEGRHPSLKNKKRILSESYLKLRRADAVEALGKVRRLGIDELKLARRNFRPAAECRPVGQWHRHIRGGQYRIGSVRRIGVNELERAVR